MKQNGQWTPRVAALPTVFSTTFSTEFELRLSVRIRVAIFSNESGARGSYQVAWKVESPEHATGYQGWAQHLDTSDDGFVAAQDLVECLIVQGWGELLGIASK